LKIFFSSHDSIKPIFAMGRRRVAAANRIKKHPLIPDPLVPLLGGPQRTGGGGSIPYLATISNQQVTLSSQKAARCRLLPLRSSLLVFDIQPDWMD
jgi:hypothetical protein